MPPKKIERSATTPYQGLERCFGEHRCPKCRRMWMSASSWADYGQQCKKCKITVPAYKRVPLEKPTGKIDETKPHPEELCQKCIALGHSCRLTYW